MSMILCGRDDVLDLMHPKYVQACEKQNPGLVERTIEAVSGEIGDALSYRIRSPGRMFRNWCATSPRPSAPTAWWGASRP